MKLETYANTTTGMESAVIYRSPALRTGNDHPYKVALTDLDADMVAGVVFFNDYDDANKFAHDLVFPKSGRILGPVCVPAIP